MPPSTPVCTYLPICLVGLGLWRLHIILSLQMAGQGDEEVSDPPVSATASPPLCNRTLLSRKAGRRSRPRLAIPAGIASRKRLFKRASPHKALRRLRTPELKSSCGGRPTPTPQGRPLSRILLGARVDARAGRAACSCARDR
eukprot:365173-Chlamydomonas_euryale.AAC.3